MDVERWQQIDQLFHSALQCGAGERSAFLTQACGGDHSLRSEVESLISSHDLLSSFIEAPATDIAADFIAGNRRQLAAGHSLGPYKIVSWLGEGGMGEVYLADDSRLGRKIALKLLPPQFTINAERVRRFEQEARAASALNHPNILTIYEIGQSNSGHFIATEFIDGETLRDHLSQTRMKVDEVLEVAAQVASALAAAHEAGIVHRDIKPENIMLRRDRIVKVLDFGLAKLAAEEVAAINITEPIGPLVKTNPGIVMGTVTYMSPEQARGLELDARTDLWSLGVVLYEMVAGRAPFAGETPSHVIVSVIESEPPPLKRYLEAPAELERIVTKALRKNKDLRYQTASDLALDLRSLKQELELEARLKRSLEPSARTGESTKNSDGQIAVDDAHASALLTAAVGTVQPTSSAEYLVAQVTRHKRATAVVLATLVMALIAAFVFFGMMRKSAPLAPDAAIKSIAVLPFKPLAAEGRNESLELGMADTLINKLSGVRQLVVSPLGRVRKYTKLEQDPLAAGRELGVDYVIEGNLQMVGEKARATVRLLRVKDGTAVFTDKCEEECRSVFELQDAVAERIAGTLARQLTGQERQQLAKQYTQSTEAYLHYNLGNYYFRQNTKEALEKSIEAFEQAIRMDPNYALAYAGLARTYQFMGSRGFAAAKEYEQKVEQAAIKALQLDDTLAEAHAFLSYSKVGNFDWVGAEKELKRALELDPNSSQANSVYANYLSVIGRADEGLPYAIRAQELDPMQNQGETAFAYFLARQYDKAIELYRKVIERKPDNAHAHILLGEAYVAKGMPAEGVELMQKGVALDVAALAKTPERWDRYPMLAYAYAAAGRRGEALKILADQHRLAKQRYVSPYNFAIIYAGLGDKDRAFEWLTKSVEQRTLPIFRLKSRPLFDSLRSDPRYADLLRRMNLEP